MNKYDKWFYELINMPKEQRLQEMRSKENEIHNLELQVFVHRLVELIEGYIKNNNILLDLIHELEGSER